MRTSNFELLRIIAILVIVMMHFCSQGNIPTDDSILIALLASGGRVAVNVFLLIGCWFMVDTPFRPERIVKLYLQIVFYSIPMTLLMLAMGEAGSFRNIAQGFTPYFGRSVWFASAYISLIALSQFLNKSFLLPPQSLRRLVILLSVLFGTVSTIPNFTPVDYVADFSWFCAVYIFVGWAKRENVFHHLGNKWICLALGLAIYGMLCAIYCQSPVRDLAHFWLINIKSLPNFAIALLIFTFFLKLDIGSHTVINRAARSVFTVYIIHQIPAFIHFEWHTIFRAETIAAQPPTLRALGILAVSLAVFVGMSIIDLFRLRLEPFYLAFRPAKWFSRKLAAALDNGGFE